MSAVTFDETAAGYARRLEDRERDRSGVTLPIARASVARRLGVAPGTFERLRAGRTKGVPAWLDHVLRSALIADFEAEIARLQHERSVLLAAPGRLAEEQVVEIDAGLEAVRKLLRGGAR